MLNCQYCGRECKNKNSLAQHEIRCKENPNAIKCFGNKGNMPKHFNQTLYRLRNGEYLNISVIDLEKYKESHNVCEICGRTIEEAIKWDSKFAPKQLCVDHNHETMQFRGLLCPLCNRQLGWYEKYKEQVNNYLNK